MGGYSISTGEPEYRGVTGGLRKKEKIGLEPGGHIADSGEAQFGPGEKITGRARRSYASAQGRKKKIGRGNTKKRDEFKGKQVRRRNGHPERKPAQANAKKR